MLADATALVSPRPCPLTRWPDMLMLTPDQIQQWHAELADYPDIQRSLQAIEDCDGDVEDAAVTLAIQAGLEPDHSDRWLASFAKRYRPVGLRDDLPHPNRGPGQSDGGQRDRATSRGLL